MSAGASLAAPPSIAASTGARAEPVRPLAWADWMRVSSMLAVVLLHSAAPLLLEHNRAGPLHFWIGNLFDSAVRWCVPVFVMLSGSLLLGRELPLRPFFAGRARKTLAPFLAWSGIYFLWAKLFRGRALTLAMFPALLVSRPVYYHLWFFYLILGLYLLAPVASTYLRAARPSSQRYLVGLWFVWACVAPILGPLLGLRVYLAPGLESSPLKLLGYFLLGHMLREARLERRGLALAGAVFLAAVALTASGTYYLTAVRQGGVFDGLLYEYFSPNVAVMSVAAFLLLRSLPPRGRLGEERESPARLRAISASVLGVYLVHPMLIDLLKAGALGIRIDQSTLHPLLGVPVFTALVAGASLAIALAMRRVPLLRALVPG